MIAAATRFPHAVAGLAIALGLAGCERERLTIPPPPPIAGLEPQVSAKILHARGLLDTDPTPENLARYARTLQAHEFEREALAAYLAAAPGLGGQELFEATYLAGLCAMHVDVDRAIELLEKAARLQDGYVPLHLRTGWLYEIAERWTDADRSHRRARDLAEAAAASEAGRALVAQAHIGLGRVALARGDVPGAIALLEKGARVMPEAPQAHAALAIAYARAGLSEKAAGSSRRAGDLEGAVGIDDPVAAKMFAEGVSTTILQTLGIEALKSNRFSTALEFFDRALAYSPDHLDGLTNKAIALTNLRRFAEAEPLVDRVLAGRPNSVPALVQKGICTMARDEATAAAGYFSRALEIDPLHASARLNLARLMRFQKRPVEAERHLRVLLDQRPHRADARLDLASLLADHGRAPEARTEIEAILAGEPAHKGALALKERLSK